MNKQQKNGHGIVVVKGLYSFLQHVNNNNDDRNSSQNVNSLLLSHFWNTISET
jgi:hypothetical protein